MISLLCVSIFVIYLFLFCKKRWESFQFFKQRGIDGPKPNFFQGNLKQFNKDSLKYMHLWYKKYQKNRTFGMFLGPTPFLVSTDLELASKVLIKDFSNFVNRGEFSPFDTIHPVTKTMLINTQLQEWKSVRNYLTPVFSTAKLKASVPMIEKGCKDLLRYCDEMASKNEEFNMHTAWKCFTTDNISRIAFGIESNTLKDPENRNPVMKRCHTIIEKAFVSWKHELFQSFPILLDIFRNTMDVLYKIGLITHPFDELMKYLYNFIEVRSKEGTSSNDFISSLLKAEAYTTSNYAEFTVKDDVEDNNTSATKVTNGTRMPQMSHESITANSALFFLAGFETTSTALGFITIRLAENENVQERLRRDILKALEQSEGKITYETAMKIPYLGQVINEVLRMDPPVTFFTSRQASTDFEFKGIQYPKGVCVMFPPTEMHYDPEYFPDPEKFDPDRFSPERKTEIPKMAFQPFGDGPRNCIGMRIALTQIKLVLCHLLINYRLLPGSERGERVARGPTVCQPTCACIRLEKLDTAPVIF